MKRLRYTIAALTLAAAATTGTALADAAIAPPDTTWGAPDTADDTTWGTAPVDLPTLPTATVDGSVTVTVTPLDTTWG